MAVQEQEVFLDSFLAERRQIIVATNIVICAVTLIFSYLKISALGNNQFPYPALLVSLFALINCIYLLRGGATDNGVLSLLLLLFLGLVFSSSYTGAFTGATVILAPILPMLAILWRSTMTGWLTMLAVGFSLSLMFGFQLNGDIPENAHSDQGQIVIRFVAVMSSAIVCTWVAWTFSRYHHELRKINERQANTDHLTGLANRLSMEQALEREIGRARRINSWVSFVMSDVDHFKRFNDRNGHLEGDRCLVQVAEVFRECATRSADLAGRFGGEEFIMLLPDTDPDGAQQLAEKARKAMCSLDIPYEANSPDRVSLTSGVVSIRGGHIESCDQLFKLADQALYEGKNKGRNCVVPVVVAGNSTSKAPATEPV